MTWRQTLCSWTLRRCACPLGCRNSAGSPLSVSARPIGPGSTKGTESAIKDSLLRKVFLHTIRGLMSTLTPFPNSNALGASLQKRVPGVTGTLPGKRPKYSLQGNPYRSPSKSLVSLSFLISSSPSARINSLPNVEGREFGLKDRFAGNRVAHRPAGGQSELIRPCSHKCWTRPRSRDGACQFLMGPEIGRLAPQAATPKAPCAIIPIGEVLGVRSSRAAWQQAKSVNTLARVAGAICFCREGSYASRRSPSRLAVASA